MVLAFLPLRENRGMCRCGSAFRRAGALPSACTHVRLEIKQEPAGSSEVAARLMTTMRPRHLTLHGLGALASIAAVARLSDLRSLTVECPTVSGFWALASLSQLTGLAICGNARYTDNDVVGRVTSLEALHLKFAESYSPMNLDFFSPLSRLERLALEHPRYDVHDMTDPTYWAPLVALPQLSELRILHKKRHEAPTLHADLGAKLRHLTLRWVSFPAATPRCVAELGTSTLRSLDICSTGRRDEPVLETMTGLVELALRFSHYQGVPIRYQEDLAPFRRLGQLESLTLQGANLRSLAHLDGMPALTSLRLSYCRHLVSLDGILARTPLRALDVAQCGFLSDIQAVSAASALTLLSLLGCPGLVPEARSVRAAAAINALTNLQTLRLDDEHERLELDPALRHLAFAGDRLYRNNIVCEGAAEGWGFACSLCGSDGRSLKLVRCRNGRCTHMLCPDCNLYDCSHSYDASPE